MDTLLGVTASCTVLPQTFSFDPPPFDPLRIAPCFHFRYVVYSACVQNKASLYLHVHASRVLKLIHEMNRFTRAYMPGNRGWAQPKPHDTTPAITNRFASVSNTCIGPPLSPWQESLPPSGIPAHIIRSLIWNRKYCVWLWHCSFDSIGTCTSCSFMGNVPSPNLPQPVTIPWERNEDTRARLIALLRAAGRESLRSDLLSSVCVAFRW